MKTLSLLLLLFYSLIANAQSGHTNNIYATENLGFGNYRGTSISVIYQRDERFSFQLDNIGMKRRFRDFPSPHFGKPSILPIKRFYSYGFHFGYTVVYNPVKHYRVSVKAGAIYSKIYTPYNVSYVPESVFLFFVPVKAYYHYDTHESESWGLSTEVAMELPLRENIGLSIGAFLRTGRGLAAYGIQVSLMLGFLYH